MRPLLTFTLLGILVLGACRQPYQPDYREASVNDQFKLEIPSSMVPSNELHDFATLQFADEKQGFFLIGITEPKEDLANLQLFYSLSDYADFVQRTVGSGLDTFVVATSHAQVVNGVPCISADMFGAISTEGDPLEVYYRVAVLESPTDFYQLIAWSSRQDFQQFRPIANHIECSFVEMPRDKSSDPEENSAAAAESL